MWPTYSYKSVPFNEKPRDIKRDASRVPVSLYCPIHALNLLENKARTHTHSVQCQVHQNKAQKSDGATEFWARLQYPADGTNVLVSNVSFGC
jgi:hypothetical protein